MTICAQQIQGSGEFWAKNRHSGRDRNLSKHDPNGLNIRLPMLDVKNCPIPQSFRPIRAGCTSCALAGLDRCSAIGSIFKQKTKVGQNTHLGRNGCILQLCVPFCGQLQPVLVQLSAVILSEPTLKEHKKD
jgi:hypothetical protein